MEKVLFCVQMPKILVECDISTDYLLSYLFMKTQMTVSVEDSFAARLRKHAKDEHIMISEIVEKAVNEHLDVADSAARLLTGIAGKKK